MLVALVAQKEQERASRFAVRWLHRFLEEHERATIEEAALAAAALAALADLQRIGFRSVGYAEEQ